MMTEFKYGGRQRQKRGMDLISGQTVPELYITSGIFQGTDNVSSRPSGKRIHLKCRRCRSVGLSPGSGRSLEKEVATHSRILAWRIPRTEEPGGLQSMGSQRDLATEPPPLCTPV